MRRIKSVLNKGNESKLTSAISNASNKNSSWLNKSNVLVADTTMCWKATVASEFAPFNPGLNYSFLKSLRNDDSEKSTPLY